MSVKRPDPVDIEVGHRIRIERLARGLSQTALANQLGVTFQQVQKYENGVNRVGAGRLTKIAEVLCGGNVTSGTPVSEQYILDLEREGFKSLCGERKTQERIQFTLKTGKTLRN